ncbi:MAG: sulfatase [Thermoanaerobaculia bacterium]|nr:sulfatase [Thermoanaerobaculia bacterium]
MTLDTTRADRLGAYGSNRGLTPNLDELAAQSAVFELAIAQSGVTPVSHASIFTGLNPYGHGLRVLHGSRYLLADDAVTVAELLSDAGYATAGVISAFPAGSRFGLAQGFGVFDEEFLEPPGPDTVQAGGTIDTGRSQRRADATTDRALAWLRQAREPYFLWVHYFDPHDTEVLPPEDFAPPQPIEGVGSSDPFEALRAVYDREVAYMDAQVGRLLAALDKNGTTILVTADHGEGLGEHGWWGHGILYQEQIHIPLLVRGPSVVARSIETMVRQVDLAPTVLDLTGFEGERPPMDGRSLLPLLEGGPTPAESSAPWAYADLMNKRVFPGVGDDGNVNDDFLLVVVDPPWKYIHHLEKPRESELYHLGDDPDEANNLLATRLDLGTSYSRQLQSLDPLPKGPTPESQMTEEELDRLRALGYVED